MYSSKIPPFTLFYDHTSEYHHLKNEIFTQGVYYFESPNQRPRIIDAGAHIGLATLYFKKLFPESSIIAIEPNPLTFSLLEKNIFENQLSDITTVPKALDNYIGVADFYLDETPEQWLSTASMTNGAWNRTQTSRKIQVETDLLANYLDRDVDFLKMDIEGSEFRVLSSLTPQELRRIKHTIIEFHPGSGYLLSELLELLERHGFTIQLWKDGQTPHLKPDRIRGLVYVEAKQKS